MRRREKLDFIFPSSIFFLCFSRLTFFSFPFPLSFDLIVEQTFFFAFAGITVCERSHPEHMTGTNDEGLERAKAGRYAFLMESSSIEYIIERHCQVTQVGGELDAKGYGIAMKKSREFECNYFSSTLTQLCTLSLCRLAVPWSFE